MTIHPVGNSGCGAVFQTGSGGDIELLEGMSQRPVNFGMVAARKHFLGDRSPLGDLTCAQRQLISHDEHRLLSTTPTFLKYLGLRDLADLPPLPELATEA